MATAQPLIRRLSDDQVEDVLTSHLNIGELSDHLGISTASVADIICGRTYRDVAPHLPRRTKTKKCQTCMHYGIERIEVADARNTCLPKVRVQNCCMLGIPEYREFGPCKAGALCAYWSASDD